MAYKNVKRSIFSIALMAGAIMTHTGAVHASETTLQRIEREGVLHAATEPAFEPFEFMQDGKIVGYGTDILHEVAKRMGVKLDQQGMAFNAILPSLMTHKVDLAATTLVANPDRRKKVDFTNAIAERSLVIITSADNNSIKVKDDFSGAVIGIQQGSALAPELKKLDESLTERKISGIRETINYQSFPEIQLALLNKQIDATMVPLTMAATWIKKQPGKFKVVSLWEPQASDDVDKNNYYWAIRIEDNDLKERINQIINELDKNGTLSALQIKWFGQSLHSMKSSLSL